MGWVVALSRGGGAVAWRRHQRTSLTNVSERLRLVEAEEALSGNRMDPRLMLGVVNVGREGARQKLIEVGYLGLASSRQLSLTINQPGVYNFSGVLWIPPYI